MQRFTPAPAPHELYKCVVSWAGVWFLISEMRELRNYYGTQSSTYTYWLKSKGDPGQDGTMMQAASPVTYAATYKPPVLLIHGGDDRIVDQNFQSIIMNRALKSAGKDVKLITFPNGHPEFIEKIR